jgi:hypothetical protein
MTSNCNSGYGSLTETKVVQLQFSAYFSLQSAKKYTLRINPQSFDRTFRLNSPSLATPIDSCSKCTLLHFSKMALRTGNT